MKNIFALVVGILGGAMAWAGHGDSFVHITGDQVDLQSKQHSFAGALGSALAIGFVNESTFESQVTLRKGQFGQETVVANFGRNAESKVLGGTFAPLNGETSHGALEIKFLKIDRATNTFTYQFNDEVVAVKITAPEFVDNHFVSPTYTATFKGKTFSWTMKDGHACYGYSAHLIMLIMGSLYYLN